MTSATTEKHVGFSPSTRTYLSLIGPVSPTQSTPEIFCADPDLLEKMNLDQDLLRSPDDTEPAVPNVRCVPDLWLEIARPPAELPFRTGDNVRVIHWTERGVVYCWEATATKIGTGNHFVMVRLISKGLTLQRRRAYRLAASIPFSFTVVDSTLRDLIGRSYSSNTENISEGGLVFSTSVKLAVGDKLRLDLHLPESERVPSVAWVVRCESPEENGGPRRDTRVALKFLQLSEDEQASLLSFLGTASHNPELLNLQANSDLTDTTISLSPLTLMK